MYAEKLKELRGTKSLGEIASVLGTTKVNYARIEKGLFEPSISELVKLCDYYNVPLSHFDLFKAEDKINQVVYLNFNKSELHLHFYI